MKFTFYGHSSFAVEKEIHYETSGYIKIDKEKVQQ